VAIGGATLDVNGIVGQLMSLEQRPVLALNKKEADYQAKISAYGNVSGTLSSFQTAVQDLTKLEKFQVMKTSSSDPAVSASATTKAATGQHTLSVAALAQAQKLSTVPQENDTSGIGAGTPVKLTFDFGSVTGGTFDETSGKYKEAAFASNGQGVKTLTIDSSNNSLQGIRDAINNAKMGITASVINNGNENAPYALTLNPTQTGGNNSLKISVEGDETLGALLAHDPAGLQNLTQTVAAQNAKFTIDGVMVSKPTNSISNVLPEVTIELQSTTEKSVTLNIARDNTVVTSAVQGFAKAYNDLNKTLQELTAFNPATKEGAVLLGDSTVRLLQSQIRTVLNAPIKTGGSLSNLSQIGITIQKDGSMALDSSKLEKAIETNATDVASLFTTVGQTTDPMISYTSAIPGTDAGNYPVKISQLATQGSWSGCEEIESLVIEADENDSLNVIVNGANAAITIAPGTYSYDGLASEIQSKINGASAIAGSGHSVTVKHDQYGYIITSNAYGSKSGVEVSGSGALNIFGQKPVVIQGLDVAGTINGTEAAGSGKTLTSKDGAATGVKLEILGGQLGERGKLSYSQGYANLLDSLITAVLAKDGQLESRKSGLNSSIADVERRRDTVQQRLPQQEARFRKQYSTLESTLSNMNKTSNYLNQQLANLPRPY
jgi:flagellar hook-associated protein 2